MGLFDKMFGRGASESEQQQGAQQRFNELKGKYQSVLNMADQQQIRFQNLHVQDNKLFIKGVAPSEDAKSKFWDQVKLVNPNGDDITADISVDQSRAVGAGCRWRPRWRADVHSRQRRHAIQDQQAVLQRPE